MEKCPLDFEENKPAWPGEIPQEAIIYLRKPSELKTFPKKIYQLPSNSVCGPEVAIYLIHSPG